MSAIATFNPDIVYSLPMDEIFVDEDFNCRGYINPVDVVDLAKDIAEQGLHTPVFVQPWDEKPGKKFRLVAGYRRFKAHVVNRNNPDYVKKVGEKAANEIRCLVKYNLGEFEARTLNLSENIHRQNLNIKQEAHAIEHFKSAGWTEQEVANKLNLSRGWVQIRFMLLSLPDDVQDEAAAGLMTGHQIRQAYTLRDNEEGLYRYIRALKDRKILGKQRPVDATKMVAKNERRIRNETEIFKLQETIREAIGNSLTTQALGWAAGANSDLEIHTALWDVASRMGKFYMIPSGLEGSRAQQVEEPVRTPD